MAAWTKTPLGMDLGLGPGDFVLDGDPAPPPQKEVGLRAAQFSTHVCCGQTAAWIKIPLGTKVGLGPDDIVNGDTAPPLQPPPQFSAHICCGQMAAWIKMPLGMEEGLGPGDFVLDGDPAPLPKKGAEPPPQFLAHVKLWPNGWMDQDGT